MRQTSLTWMGGGAYSKTLIYFLLAGISHFYFYFLLANFVVIYPMLFAFKRGKVLFCCVLFVNAFWQILLFSDAHLFYLYRFHLSFAMLDLFFNAGSEVISLSLATWISIILQVGFILAYTFIITLLAFYFESKSTQIRIFVLILPAFLLVYLGVNLTHAYAMAKQKFEFISLTNYLPLYKPLTMNDLFLKLGIVSESELGKNDFKLSQNGFFHYPKEPLRYNDEIPRYNVLLLLSDSLRADMLNPTNMPHTYKFTQNASVYTRHYASSNSTRGGVFGLFYGLPPSYWQAALNSGKGAALIDALQHRNYEFGIFTTANLYSPEFHQTIFASVANLRLGSKGATFIEREQNTIKDFENFIIQRDRTKPFFSFVFLDNIHAYAFADDFTPKFVPYKSINHLALNKDSNASEYFNLYQNAVLYTDENFHKIIELLKANDAFHNTIIIISADHGEEFNEDRDNFWGHNNNFKDYQIKIPLVIKWAQQVVGEQITQKTGAYDISTTLMQEVLGVTNDTRTYSIGQNLFHLIPREYVLAGSYTENAIIEDERIIVIDALGMLHFKDKQYKNSKDTSRKNVLEPYKIFYEYLQRE